MELPFLHGDASDDDILLQADILDADFQIHPGDVLVMIASPQGRLTIERLLTRRAGRPEPAELTGKSP